MTNTSEKYERAQQGNLLVRASPSVPVPRRWLSASEALLDIEDPAKVANNVNHHGNTHSWEKMHGCNKSDISCVYARSINAHSWNSLGTENFFTKATNVHILPSEKTQPQKLCTANFSSEILKTHKDRPSRLKNKIF